MFSQVRNQLYARLQPQEDPNAPVEGPSNLSPSPMPSPTAAPSTAPAPSASPAPSPFNYEAARDSWMSGQYGKDEAGAAQWAQQYGIPYSGGDTISLPNGGGLIDILGNFKSGQNVANNWTPAGGNGPNPNGQPAGAASGGLQTAAGSGNGNFQSSIRALLMQQLQGLSQPVSAEDPTIANEMNVQSRLIDRNREQRRAAMAERMAFTGLSSGGAGSGAFESEIASGYEDAGQQKSGVLAQLMGRELTNRRSQLAQMLSLATQSGDAESARALQFQLAQMDAELRRMGIGEQARQFNDQFGRALGRDAEDDFRYRFEAGF